PAVSLERAIKHRKMLGTQTARYRVAVLLNILNRVILFNVTDDAFRFRFGIAEAVEGFGNGAVNDLEHASTSQQLILHERDIRLNPGRVAIHEKRDRPGRGE